MAGTDLRSWLADVEKIEPVKEINGAHWDLEIGVITKFVQIKARQEFPRSFPALMFDEIPDYPKGFRVLVDPLDSIKRLAFSLNLPLDLTPLEFVRAWREKFKNVPRTPVKQVKTGSLMENVCSGNEVDLLKFPTPKWHEQDGGRYIGTGCVFITQDPDEGWTNLGTYRAVIHDANRLGIWIAPGQHARIHMEKCFSRNQPCKMAISVGHHPLLTLAGCMSLPWGFSEYELVGGLLGQPLPVITGPYTGLPLPADAELVIEGECLPGDIEVEGPFGEYTGYYGRPANPQPVLRVKNIMYRNDPIMLGVPPAKGGRIFMYFMDPAGIWEELEKAGVPDVKGVWCPTAVGTNLIIVVAIKQRYPGHARQAALLASSCQSGARVGRFVIVVDDDIDPSNTSDVLWALATRSDPERSIEIIRRCWNSPIDPVLPPNAFPYNSRALIDACRPYEWKDEFPKVVEVSTDLRHSVWNKWGKELEALIGKP